MITSSLVLTALLFGIYGWLCSVECGISLLRLLPSSTLTKLGLRLLRPLWGVTTIFLIFALVAYAVLFNNGLSATTHAVRTSLLVALVAFVVRAVFVLYLAYGGVKTGLRWQNIFFGAISLLVPLNVGAAGVCLLSGQMFWQTSMGWLLMLALASGLLALGLSFVYFVVGRTPHDRLHQVSRWLTVLMATVVLLLAHGGHLSSTAYDIFLLSAVAIILLQLIFGLSARERNMWWFLSAFAILSPLLLALADRPYLLFPSVLISKAYGTNADAGLLIISPLVILGIGLSVWYLFTPQTTPVKKRKG